MSAKSFFLLQGVGDSGKSVLGNLISSMFNPEALAHLDIYRFKEKFSTSALIDKRLNICMDLPRARISREAIGVIKMLTGDDTITIEQKFRPSESYKPTCKLLFGSNFPLMPADNDPAFCSRLVNTFNWTLDLSSLEAGARHLQPSEIALLQYRERQSGNMDTILDRHSTDPQPLFTITITKEEAQAYCRSIGMKFFGKKWQDKTVIISI